MALVGSSLVRVTRPVSEDEMILAFLQAECDAPRWKAWIAEALGGDLTPITTPNLEDDEQNAMRRHALGQYRGYGRDGYIFRGFPADTEWFAATVTCAELAAFRYLNHKTFIELSQGSRLVGDGAANLDVVTAQEGLNDRIRGLRDAVEAGRRFPALIAVAHARDVPPVLIEGNTRATAYVLALPAEDEVAVISGYSAGLQTWPFY
jgi:hypothetical protein